MTNGFDTQALWEALQSHPRFDDYIPLELREAYKSYVMEVPQVLAHLLNEPVTVKTLIQAKFALFKLFTSRGLVELVVTKMSSELKVHMSDEEILSFAHDAIEQHGLKLETQAFNLSTNMIIAGVTDQDFFSNPDLGFSPELQKRIANGMTIGELLLERPSVIMMDV
jgi:hypothetical protein